MPWDQRLEIDLLAVIARLSNSGWEVTVEETTEKDGTVFVKLILAKTTT